MLKYLSINKQKSKSNFVRNSIKLLSLAALLAVPFGINAQPQRDANQPAANERKDLTMTIEEYEPKSTLKVPVNLITRAKYPFIDIHNHQPFNPTPERLDQVVKDMEALNMYAMINLSGRWGNDLAVNTKAYGKYPKQFITFANINYEGIDEPGYKERAAAQLHEDYKNGARGVKIGKSLGLTVKDSKGNRVRVDDPRLDGVWAKCAELGIPVLIHTAEPASFFDNHDKYNERWLELKQFPDRYRPPTDYPTFEELITEQENLFGNHPKTTFINAHMGWFGGDLVRAGKQLERFPNIYSEIGAVIAELGRQPKFAREWFIKYQDRVIFGKDIWNPAEYHVYFRVLESSDEYFDYYRKRHAFWKMYGMNLPDDVLKKLYYKNALKILPWVDKTAFPE